MAQPTWSNAICLATSRLCELEQVTLPVWATTDRRIHIQWDVVRISQVSYNMVVAKETIPGWAALVRWVGDRIRAGAPTKPSRTQLATLLQAASWPLSPSNCCCPREPVSRHSLLRWQVVASAQASRAGPLVAWLAAGVLSWLGCGAVHWGDA